MSWTRSARAIIAFALLVLLHYTLRPLLGWRTPVDFLVIAVLLSAVRVRPGAAALIGFCTGLVADSLTPSAFGAGALAMTAVGATASWLKAVFFADNVVLHGFFFFVGTAVTVTLAALVAIGVPAVRASRVDPLRALRCARRRHRTRIVM